MFNPHATHLRAHLGKLHRYATSVEAFLTAEASSLDSQVEAGMNALPPEAQTDYLESYLDDLFELSEDLPTILRNSVLTAADSAFEQALVATCTSHAESIKSELSLRDLSGSTLGKVQTYLKKIAKISFPDQIPSWHTVLRLREFRNAIVHADGEIDSSKSELIRWLDSLPTIRRNRYNTVMITAEFIPFALDAYDDFAEAFDSACEPLGLYWHLSGFKVETEPQTPNASQ